jgi:glycosyltransferase involved in cell wall biosynthesis
MKVALLCPRLSRRGGGISAAVISLAEAIGTSTEIIPELIGFEPPEPGSTRLAPRIVRAYGPIIFPIAPRLGSLLSAGAYDVVHTHGLWSWASVAAASWARRSRRALIVSAHGMLDHWALANSAWRKRSAMALFERGHLKQAACIHALTQAEAGAIRAAGFSAPIAVIPNGVDLPAAVVCPPRHRMPKDGRRVLLFLGRLHPKKGIGPLCAAWGKAVAIDPTIAETWQLVIAGWDDGGHLPAFRTAAAQSGAAESIAFCGALYGSEKAAAYAHADAFILPSFSEGLPMTVLEAWAHGCAVFATASCNLPEGFKAGAAIPITTEPDEMAAVLVQALPDAKRLAAAGDAGRRLVLHQFAWAGIAAQWRTVYAWATGRAPAPECVLAPQPTAA